MNDTTGIDKANVEAINRWLDEHPGISNREAGRRLGIHESYVRRAKSARPKGTMQTLQIASIVRTSATQPRIAIDPETVERYVRAKRDGAKFRPPVVFDDGKVNRMGDGFHRTEADIVLGLTEIECEVREGGEREAYRYAITANLVNGLPLSSADVKACVLRLAIDEPKLSKRELARIVGVDEKQVRRWLEPAKPEVRTVSAPKDTGQFIEDDDSPVVDSGPMPDSLRNPNPPTGHELITLDDDFDDPGRLPSLAVKRPEPPPMVGDLPEPVEKLTDAEWLAGLSVRAKLSDTTRAVFDRDALIYRQLVTENADYQRWVVTAKKLIDSKTPGLRGHYHAAFQRLLRLKHPASALVCGECSGKGCDTCNRRGYQLG